MTVYYFARADLDNALGKNTVLAVYDDDLDGVADTDALTGCYSYATAECNSFLRALYPSASLPLASVPDEVKFASLDFGIAYTMRRRPDLIRAMGEEKWTVFRDSAIEKMQRYVKAMQRLPASVGTPSNVGGVSINTADSADESSTPRRGFFEDMGAFSYTPPRGD